MGCSKCCAPTRPNQRCCTLLNVLIATAVLACSIWALTQSNTVKDNTMCIVNNFNTLIATPPPGVNASVQDEIKSLINQDSVDQVEDILDWWVASMITPGAVFFGLLVVAAIFAWWATSTNSGACPSICSKLFIFFALLAGLTAIVFFVICTILGVAASIDSTSSWWNTNVKKPCSTMTSDYVNQLSEANKTVTQCEQLAPSPEVQCADARREYNYASEQFNAFDAFCACASRWIDEAKPFAAPGFVGVITTIVALFFNLGLCCTLNCCGSMKKADGDFTGIEAGR